MLRTMKTINIRIAILLLFVLPFLGCKHKPISSEKDNDSNLDRKELPIAYSMGEFNFFEIGEFILKLPISSKVYLSNQLDFTLFEVSDSLESDFSIYYGNFPSCPFPLSDYLSAINRGDTKQLEKLDNLEGIYRDKIATSVWDTINGEYKQSGQIDTMMFEYINKNNEFRIFSRFPYNCVNTTIDVVIVPFSDSIQSRLHFFKESCKKEDYLYLSKCAKDVNMKKK